jgi:hypothetical protein
MIKLKSFFLTKLILSDESWKLIYAATAVVVVVVAVVVVSLNKPQQHNL